MFFFDRKIKAFWKNYLLQSFFASVAIFIVLLILSRQRAVIIAAIGATAFLVFTMPGKITAQPKNIIGGYITGLVCGSLFSFMAPVSFLASAALYACAVGLSIFIMVILNVEHPPASGVALGIAMNGFSVDVAITTVISAVTLAVIHNLFKRYLKDLI